MDMGNAQLTPEQLEALLKFASSKLGISEQQLARTVQSGNIDDLGLSPESSKKLEGLIGGRNSAETLLQSPQVKALLSQLLGGEKN